MKKRNELFPDEIFLDSRNLPEFDVQQFEGTMEKAIAKANLYLFSVVCFLVFFIFLGRIFYLEAVLGKHYANRSSNNSLNLTVIFPARGNIYDRRGEELAWNNDGRRYDSSPAISHLLGYVGYPDEDDVKGHDYEPKEIIGKSGAEKVFNNRLVGGKGVRIVEVNASDEVESDHIVRRPQSGEDIYLSIDAEVERRFYEIIEAVARDRGFSAGAGVIIDVETGELLALTSFPGYDPNLIAVGRDKGKIGEYFADNRNPLLNRAISGLYTPGSIIKPFIAAAALAENIISPEKTIFSSGQLEVVNPYDKTNKSIFKDWKAHGAVDMRRALAVSSNVYFYQISGGFGNQIGLGIAKIEKYLKHFGFATPTGINLAGESIGEIPSPDWKAEHFDGEPWRIGDTYHTAIGQYGLTVTPLEIAVAYGAIANGGAILTPTISKQKPNAKPIGKKVPVKPEQLQIIREGLRLAVTDGTAKGLDLPNLAVAAKTGTAELGVSKEKVNSWVTGFFPYEKPRYAFAVVMEKGNRSNTIGGVFVMRQLLDWLVREKPEIVDSSL